MKSCIQTFDTGVSELSSYLSSTEDEAALITLLLKKKDVPEEEKQLITSIKSAHVGRKQYIYSVAIISLYGLLERFVDSLIESFVHRIAKLVKTYKELPTAIVARHTQLSLELVKAIVDDRHRSGITEAEVVQNLHLCLSGAENFQVNGAAFVLHRGNIYLNKIGDFLTSIGVDAHLRRASLTRDMLECFQDVYPDRDIRNVADQDLPALFGPIDSLVDRRNEISHGVISVEDIESVDLLKSRCRFLSAYAHALYNVVLQEFLKYRLSHSNVHSLGKPVNVFDNSIVCFNISNARVAVGDLMAARTGELMETFRYGRINSLQVDRVAHKEIVATDLVCFGAKVPFRASAQYEYFVFSDDTI
jgi:hypothetical protein